MAYFVYLHSFISGRLGCFHLLVAMNKYLFMSLLSVFLAIHPEVELLDDLIILLLIFGGTAILFSIVAAPFNIQLEPEAQSIEFSLFKNCFVFHIYNFRAFSIRIEFDLTFFRRIVQSQLDSTYFRYIIQLFFPLYFGN